MKKKNSQLLIALVLSWMFPINAQTNTFKLNTNKAITYLENENYSKLDSIAAVELLKPCVSGKYPHALFVMGRLHLNNHIIEDDETGFKLIKKSAKQGFAKACTDLGNLFKYGIGCDMDYKKAKKWYKKAHDLGDARGTYSVGYLHYKGLGVKQNYNKAIKWFNQSDYPMAKHWLGVAHYFGYGVPVNKQKAMALLKENYIENSDVMLHCMEFHLNRDEENKTDVAFMEILNSDLKNDELSFNYLKGTWSGNLVQLDWSEKNVEQVFPVSVEFSKNPDDERVLYKLNLSEQAYEGIVENFDSKLLFDDFNYDFKRPYFNDNDEQNVSYGIKSASFDISTYQDQEYLTAVLDTYVTTMQEPGNSLALVLKKEESITENGKIISDEVADALSEQTDDFIKLYPNPFESDLFISYNLEDRGLVHIEVSDLNGNQSYVLEEGRLQNSGNYTYYFNGATLPQGISVITVFVNGGKHTKLIAKK